MNLYHYQSILRTARVAMSGVFLGVTVTLAMMQYQGKFELRFNNEEAYIMLDSKHCDLIANTPE